MYSGTLLAQNADGPYKRAKGPFTIQIHHAELFAVLNSGLPISFKEAIFFCMMGLPIFGKEGSGTPVFKIVVRACESWPFEILMDPLENLVYTYLFLK